MAEEDTSTDVELDLDVDDFDEFGTTGVIKMCGVSQSSNVQCSNPMCA
ncbi:hypothetical protein JOD64_005505 [Micromonospora luteifusca]|uniref:FxLD family lantipeptide n=1 Tax=Micromonospora luteifusca TaxID=709860 RepID=A0ABS2M1F3_9ACTN|nr:hypothetical protein [Micromonospora luteifusca]MBM7494283.1 hypothetical protein [Micromonospora luteifusca]